MKRCAAGTPNRDKMDIVIEKNEASRKEGILFTADMYTYVVGATGFDVSMPTWVQAGGYEKWARLIPGICADIAIFDPDTIEDRVTFEDTQQYAVRSLEWVEHDGTATQ